MNIGLPEILGVLALALLLFGAKKLPELGSSVGQSIRNFKRGVHEAEAEDTRKDASREDATGRREL